MSILSFLTLEDRQTVDPREAIKWGDVSIDEKIRPQELPRLHHSGVRIYNLGALTENRRLFLQESADRVLADEGPQEVQIHAGNKLHHAWMLIRDVSDFRIKNTRNVVFLSDALLSAAPISEIDEALLVEVALNPQDDPAFARADPEAMKKMFARLRTTLRVSLAPSASTGHGILTDPPVLKVGRMTPTERLAAQREDFLNRGWPTAAELARAWGSTSENSSRFTSSLRREKKLFGFWSTRHGGTYIHPDFQFRHRTPDSKEALLPRIPDLLKTLERIPGFSDRENEDAGRWRRLFWLYTERPELSERSLAEKTAQAHGVSPLMALRDSEGLSETPRMPADVFEDYPDAVIELARKDAADDCARV